MSSFTLPTFLRTSLREMGRSLHTHPPPRRRFLTLSDPLLTSKPHPSLASRLKPTRIQTSSALRRQATRRFQSTHPSPKENSTPAPSPNPTPHLGSPEPATLSLSQRLRKLSREYGWSAVGVYFALSALDFPFCFLAVRVIGTERIGHWEHVIVGYAWRLFTLDGRVGTAHQGADEAELGKTVEDATIGGGVVAVSQQGGDAIARAGDGKGWSWGVEAADEANSKSDATIWTQLALAYAIHKSFIFLRVPATVAVTPKVVKVLRGWGWNVGKMPKRTPKKGTE